MKISARNQIKGEITAIHRGATTSHVLVEIGNGSTMMASITNEAVDELGLAVGKPVTAVVKASDVMIATD